ncbi:MAG: tRNA (adenosine(37)-N6)-threonylcarbamoyltransferase complex ATPase subunit type 1 TsaE [Cytophagales bacterium]|nr:tRNA (adenosine(37)-N6)-threonylcarbamoyltransferase complex ATPase subunit type 1 TsaE [Cytophagales bacterium]
MKIHLKSLNDLSQVACQIIDLAQDYKIWDFVGEMGAGKTTLIKEVCKQIGVEENVSSPTFSIVNEYESVKGDTLFHFDFYRMEDEEEAFDMGVEEYFESGDICFLEWSELIPSYLPPHRLEVAVDLLEDNTREITLSFHQ